MLNTIRLEPSGAVFTAAYDSTILEAALGAGIAIANSCRRGTCRACRARVVSGRWRGTAAPVGGSILLCSSYALSDLTLDVDVLSAGASAALVQSFPARIEELTRLADDVMLMRLQLPRGVRLDAQPGQYVEIVGDDGRRHAFSLGRAVDATKEPLLELHVRRMHGGRFTSRVFDAFRPGELLKLKAPYGNFGATFRSEKPTIFIAGGTGFAPIKAILERAFEDGSVTETHLYWGARTMDGIYMHDLCRAWDAAHSGFRFVPVISDGAATEGSERTGLVHQAVLDDFANLAGHSVFACGNSAFVEAARRTLTQGRGLAEEQFFADPYELPLPAATPL